MADALSPSDPWSPVYPADELPPKPKAKPVTVTKTAAKPAPAPAPKA